MAKATPKKAAKPAAKTTKPGRRPASAKTTKVVKAAAPAKKPAAVKAPLVSKDELRAQLEKAQNTIATLRTKSRDAVRAAKAAAAQIVELEAKVTELEKKVGAQAKPAKPAATAAKPVKQRGRKAAAKADLDVPVKSDAVPVEFLIWHRRSHRPRPPPRIKSYKMLCAGVAEQIWAAPAIPAPSSLPLTPNPRQTASDRPACTTAMQLSPSPAERPAARLLPGEPPASAVHIGTTGHRPSGRQTRIRAWVC